LSAELSAFTHRPFRYNPDIFIMRRAIYPGSFDPLTNGHLDVLQRAAGIFDKVIIAVARDNAKTSLFSVEERVDLIRNAAAEIPGIEVLPFDGLLVNFAREKGACALIRGLRAVSDFEFEFQLALMNRKLQPNLETLFLMPREEFTYISSRLVKEICRLGGHIEQFVPPNVAAALCSKLQTS
jgi:pantetheine-phosphate adenylyltransferase